MKYTFLLPLFFLAAFAVAQESSPNSPSASNSPNQNPSPDQSASSPPNTDAKNETDKSTNGAKSSTDSNNEPSNSSKSAADTGENNSSNPSAADGNNTASTGPALPSSSNSTIGLNGSLGKSANVTGSLNGSSINATLNGSLPNATLTNLNATSNSSASCPVKCHRREFRSLSEAERMAYFSAIKKLMSGPSPTKYDNLVSLHIAAKTHAHSTAYFLPWHRGYLKEFEKALQAIDPKICIPYWNWSLDSQAPEASSVFTKAYYGTNGNNNTGCVEDGVFAGWKPAYPSPHCLKRNFKYKTNLGAFQSFEAINKIVTDNSDYAAFRDRLEMLAHPTPHVNIGGDMAEMHSPNDPVFWLHHTYIDYVWSKWQKKNGKVKFAGKDENGQSATLKNTALGLNLTYEGLLDDEKLCYSYADLEEKDLSEVPLPPPTVQKPEGNQAPNMTKQEPIPTNDEQRLAPNDRTNLNILRIPDPAGDEFCKKFGLDIKQVRDFEEKNKNLYKDLNKIEGYVSPCALWKRPALSTKIVEQQKQDLCVDVPGYGRIVIQYDHNANPMQAVSNVKKRAELCTPNIEMEPEKYRDRLEKLVGKAAFDGAGTGVLRKMDDGDQLSHAVSLGLSMGWLMVVNAFVWW